MKKTILSLCMLVLCLFANAQQISVSNNEPSWGTKITVYYQPDSTSQFKLGDEVYMRYTAIKEDSDQLSDLVKMKEEEGRFAAEIAVQEGHAAYTMQFQSGNTFDRAANLAVQTRDAKGQYYRNAYLLQLMQNPDLYKNELENYPDNFSVYRTRWQLLGYTAKDSVAQIIQRELKELDRQGIQNAAYFYAKAAGNAQLGNWDEARKAIGQMMGEFPASALIEDAYSWFQYQCFSQSAPDTILQKQIRTFIEDHPKNSIAKAQMHLFYEDNKVRNKEALHTAANYWLEKDPSDPLLYYHLAKASKGSGEINQLLGKASDMLLDPFSMMKHYHSWSVDIPYYLMQIMEAYKENDNPQAAWETIGLIEDNTTKLGADHFQQKGELLITLDQPKAAIEAYLIASDQGDTEAKQTAKTLFDEHLSGEGTEFEVYAETLLRRLFYEEKVEPAAPFSVTDIEGNTYSSEELKGKVVVLNFWFIGCAPCRIEIPGLNEMVRHYDKEQVVFIAFALDGKEALEKFLTELPFDYTIIPEAFDQAAAYSVQGYPTHVILDKRGNVRSTLTGGSADRHKQIQPLIDRLLRY
ncbi:MAG: TlpA family protein disulfide reductase [Saprospiraceae bacterium]|nr:TlpA family protein disulfide reductase [Saprospiraceae bacterium]